MKKFLCYDTNDAASGKINVDNRGMLKPNSTVPSGSTPYQQLVTDGEGGVKWEDRLAYENTRISSELIDINGRNSGNAATSSGKNYYKVSDYVFTVEQFKQMHYVVLTYVNFTEHEDDYSITEIAGQGGINSHSGIIAIQDGTSAPVIVSQEAVDSGAHVSGGASDTFPEPGVYFPARGGVTRLYSVEPIAISNTEVKKIDKKFLPTELNTKMDKNNPVGTGSFSMNRANGSGIGSYSHTEGESCIASGDSSHAEGSRTEAIGNCSHAEGFRSIASGDFSSHAEGQSCTASGDNSHAEGLNSIASGDFGSHAEGNSCTASGDSSHAEGQGTHAEGACSHTEGEGTIAKNNYQHVQGKYNVTDKNNKYAHIVGNGSSKTPSNAHTLDWNGNAWYAGTVEGTAMIVKSSTEGSSKRFKITVDDSGTISATEVTT